MENVNYHFKEISLIMDDKKKHIFEHINQNFKLYLSQSISDIINMINLENRLVRISQIHGILFLKRDA